MMEVTTQDRWRRRRRLALVSLYVVSLGTGTLDGFLASAPSGQAHPDVAVRVAVLTGLLFSLGSLWFCTADAWLAGRPLIEMARLGIFFGWPVGVPLYLVCVRGIRGFGLLLLHGIGLLLMGVGSMAATIYLVYNR